MKKKEIKLGDRVNVIEVITETWQSEKSLINGYVYKVEKRQFYTYVRVCTDTKRVNDGLKGGVYIIGAYSIETI